MGVVGLVWDCCWVGLGLKALRMLENDRVEVFGCVISSCEFD